MPRTRPPTLPAERRRAPRPSRPLLLLSLPLLASACGGADDVVYTADRVVVYDPDALTAPTTTLVVPEGPVVIERIWSPEPSVAEVLGTGAIAADPVTVDDAPGEVLTFVIDDAGAFTLRVLIEEEGAHTVCIRDECGRVFVEPPR